jgi:hypothetical protein
LDRRRCAGRTENRLTGYKRAVVAERADNKNKAYRIPRRPAFSSHLINRHTGRLAYQGVTSQDLQISGCNSVRYENSIRVQGMACCCYPCRDAIGLLELPRLSAQSARPQGTVSITAPPYALTFAAASITHQPCPNNSGIPWVRMCNDLHLISKVMLLTFAF